MFRDFHSSCQTRERTASPKSRTENCSPCSGWPSPSRMRKLWAETSRWYAKLESGPKMGAICRSRAAATSQAPPRPREASLPPCIGPSRSRPTGMVLRTCSSTPYSHWSRGCPSSFDMQRSTWLPPAAALPMGPTSEGSTTPCATWCGTRSTAVAAEAGSAPASSRRTSASQRQASSISFVAGVDHFSASSRPSSAAPASRTSQTTPKEPRPSSRTRLKVRPERQTAWQVSAACVSGGAACC
mmetsp:Transcript_5941/g.17500  ORF Transcript_5941/g.17500 Transcript_5941/m.17500 type:complete len:242 (+) Transcript_5941:583-1308(+)